MLKLGSSVCSLPPYELPKPIGPDWQLRDLDAHGTQCVTNGVAQGTGDRAGSAFAHPSSSERCVFARRIRMQHFNMWQAVRVSQLIVLKRRGELLAIFVIEKLFKHGVRESLNDATMDLAFHDLRIDRTTDIPCDDDTIN